MKKLGGWNWRDVYRYPVAAILNRLMLHWARQEINGKTEVAKKRNRAHRVLFAWGYLV